MRTLRAIILGLFVLPAPAPGQPAPLMLLNPSFEDEPWHSKPPSGWYFCGAPGETPPDVHPTGLFAVDHEPAHGQTYVGMVVRDNGTWEALGQHLEHPLSPEHCYRFSLAAMHSPRYRSISRLTGQRVEYTAPVRLRLWGGRNTCDRAELLAASEPVSDTNWTTLDFHLHPRQYHHYFIIEAYYPTDSVADYRGNVLIDRCSPLLPVACPDGEVLAPCPVLAFPAPAGRQELETLIGRLAPGVTFVDGTTELRNQYYRTAGEAEPMQENAALHQLVRAVQQLPEQELEFAVSGPGKLLVQQRIARLEKRLLSLGLDPRQYKVGPHRRRSQRLDWLGVNRSGDLHLRLR